MIKYLPQVPGVDDSLGGPAHRESLLLRDVHGSLNSVINSILHLEGNAWFPINVP